MRKSKKTQVSRSRRGIAHSKKLRQRAVIKEDKARSNTLYKRRASQ